MSLNTAELGRHAHDQHSQAGASWSSTISAKLSLGLTSCLQETSCILFLEANLPGCQFRSSRVPNGTSGVSQMWIFCRADHRVHKPASPLALRSYAVLAMALSWNHTLSEPRASPASLALGSDGHGQLSFAFVSGRTTLHFSVLLNILI